ncbi:hypothetical protein G3N56_15585 [Desulfovibrio sulfodismutans]|uniref:Uncharacterized protein n=1 Tax=Desulfolutivibrio sulfodismutans TaxID=63561 RepID=A0A7K3NPX0_9BACT|nr:hypothetical protein [Desulfolutivibrio sulfodismutans]NDY58157.1 hypothetical protein [Desulfolutivibrio sulfodismutans]QLA12283.1 hypothetical protein GD606_08360 [Desulfolutivibrio sulfodismutans DSM 3696]
MSNLYIGLVSEGPTDTIIIQSALQAILDHPFVLSPIQPESPPGQLGAGWSGVYRWCRQIASPNYYSLLQHPSLMLFNIIIIQVDADVAFSSYSSANICDNINNDLPCAEDWPPITRSIENLKLTISKWTHPTNHDKKTVLCIPSYCIETWLAVALFGKSDPILMSNIEQNTNIYNYIYAKSKTIRFIRFKDGKPKKIKSKYIEYKDRLTSEWNYITRHCTQAIDFQNHILFAASQR